MNRNEKLRRAGKISAADWDKIAIRAESLMEGHKFGCSEAVIISFMEVFEDYFSEAMVAMSSAFRGGMVPAHAVSNSVAPMIAPIRTSKRTCTKPPLSKNRPQANAISVKIRPFR